MITLLSGYTLKKRNVHDLLLKHFNRSFILNTVCGIKIVTINVLNKVLL